jgi:uncharacterized membrane protein YccC
VLTWLRELAATVGTFDRSALEPGYALRCTVGVAIPLVIAALLGNPAAGVPAAIGAFITGFTSLQGIYRTRLVAVLAAAVGMSLLSFIGALSAHSLAALVAATIVAGYAFGTIQQLGPAAATVSLNSFVAFVLFSSQPLPPPAAAAQAGMVLAGGAIQALLLLIAWPIARGRVERCALAEVYLQLASYAREIAAGQSTFPPVTPLATARQILSDPQPFVGAAEVARFNRLFEDAAIIRRRLGALAAPATRSRSASAEFARIVAQRLDDIAAVLAGHAQELEVSALTPPQALELIGGPDVASHVRDASEAAMMLTSRRLPNFHLLSKPRPGPYVQNHIDWFSRDSIRFALVLAIAMALGRHFAADRGYWIPLTAALVLKPDFQTTFVRGAARIAGTLVGAVVASLTVALVRGNAPAEIGGILLAAGAAYLTFNPNYAVFTVAITSFVVMVLSMRGLPGTTAIAARLLDTLAGGALAMIGYVTMPSWERKRTRSLLAELLDAQRRLAAAILHAYATPSNEASAAIDAARSDVWKARTTVEASIDRTRHEPRRHHTIGAARAVRILAATQRFALASLALETALESQPPLPLNALVPFAAALDAQMSELSNALREARRARTSDRLNAAVSALDSQLGRSADPQQRFVVERLRAYAEAANRIARLVGISTA